MIKKIKLMHLRNAEHFQYMVGANQIFDKYGFASQLLSPSYGELSRLRNEEEKSMAIERNNAKIKEKSVTDHFRDKLHSKLFNSVKVILYDETDPSFDMAQRVMAVIKSVGNPRNLAENAESAMLTTLTNKLEPYRADMEAMSVLPHLDKLTEANLHFIQLETECREIVSIRAVVNVPSVAVIRKQIDPVYHTIIDYLNVHIKLNGDTDCQSLVAELNTLVEKYDTLLAQRKVHTKKKNGEQETAVE
ncbi:MAG: DUF6261 family protein [Flavobacteriaceae bacterium]|jgi:hypothetical protein|nr:DUF6261 family protein [Flavobacteriaceae bacterium]